MAARADDLDNRKPEREKRDPKAPAPPLPTRVTSTEAVIERAIARHRETLDLLAKR